MQSKTFILLASLLISQSALAGVADQMQLEFEQQSSSADAQAGKALWEQKFTDAQTGKERSCNSCHGNNLKVAGKHERTNKVIEPMAPSVNAERLTDRAKINKWFKRNCKWTLGRECTAQEKANVLAWIKNQ